MTSGLYQKPRAKGQTTLVLIVLVIIVFGGLVLFLLTLASGVTRTEYLNIYTHNLLLTTLRTDTGQLDADCKLISDTLLSAFGTTAKTTCGTSGLTYQQLAEQRITEYLDGFELLKKYRYLLVARSGTPDWMPTDPTGQPMEIRIASAPEDLGLDEEKIEKLVAGERIQRGSYIISVQLFLVKKAE